MLVDIREFSTEIVGILRNFQQRLVLLEQERNIHGEKRVEVDKAIDHEIDKLGKQAHKRLESSLHHSDELISLAGQLSEAILQRIVKSTNWQSSPEEIASIVEQEWGQCRVVYAKVFSDRKFSKLRGKTLEILDRVAKTTQDDGKRSFSTVMDKLNHQQ